MVATNVFIFKLWGRQVGNHSQEDLAKFGYKSKRKVKKLGLNSHILATCWNLLSKYGKFRFFFPPHSVRTWAHFSPQTKTFVSFTPLLLLLLGCEKFIAKKKHLTPIFGQEIPMYLILIIIIWTFKLTFKYFNNFSHKQVVNSKMWNLTVK